MRRWRRLGFPNEGKSPVTDYLLPGIARQGAHEVSIESFLSQSVRMGAPSLEPPLIEIN